MPPRKKKPIDPNAAPVAAAPADGATTEPEKKEAPAICVKLARITVKTDDWQRVTPATKRMLRVPLAWRQRKDGTLRAYQLPWNGGSSATVVAGSAHSSEVLTALNTLGVKFTVEISASSFRRTPAGAVMTDPKGNGDKAEVETIGALVLVRNRRKRWVRAGQSASLLRERDSDWLAESIAMVNGFAGERYDIAPTRRWAVEDGKVEQGTMKAGRMPPKPKTTWAEVLCEFNYEKARELFDERLVKIEELTLASPPSLRLVDLGTKVVRASAVWREGKYVRIDVHPGFIQPKTPKVAKPAKPRLSDGALRAANDSQPSSV